MEQSLQPDDQMWVDVGQLIRTQAPDINGNSLPSTLTTGSYEITDVSHTGAGTLFEGKVIYDKMYGHAAYGCALCCGYATASAILWYNPLGIPDGGTTPQGVQAEDMCQGGAYDDVSSAFYGSWSVNNPSIATADHYGTHTGESDGSTNSCTTGHLNSNDVHMGCPLKAFSPCGTDNVISFTINHDPYIFVGSDTGLHNPNTFAANVSPEGGTLTATSSDSHDTFTYGNISGSSTATITTPDQSTNNLDRTLTFTYTVSGQGSVPQTLVVTARQFAYATNNTPGNICSLGHGYKYEYVYTPYTHPDKTAVQPGIGLDGTAATESFSPPLTCGNDTGNGTLDANSQFTDIIAFCSTDPLPTCSSTSNQTWKVAGFTVRTNSLTIANTGLTYTSQGPTQ